MKLSLIITILTVVCFATSCTNSEEFGIIPKITPSPKPQTVITELTEAQAVAFAEKFIEQNGYTDLPPDKKSLSNESIEWESNIDEMLKLRHNTLERQAYGISLGRRSGSGFTVVFRYTARSSKEETNNGRAVTMNLDGSNARVEHKDFILSKIGKKLVKSNL